LKHLNVECYQAAGIGQRRKTDQPRKMSLHTQFSFKNHKGI